LILQHEICALASFRRVARIRRRIAHGRLWRRNKEELGANQIGFNASVDQEPWSWAVALVRGFGKIDSSRDTGVGIAGAGYTGQIAGALTEFSHCWSLDQSRTAPRPSRIRARSASSTNGSSRNSYRLFLTART